MTERKEGFSMNRSIIYLIVIMAFAFIIGKYKLLPYLAAKKILKDSKKDAPDLSTSSPVIPSQIPLSMAYGGYPYPVAQSQPEKPSRRDMYFDYRLFCVNLGNVEVIGDAIESSLHEMLATLRNRGICSDSLNIVPIDDGLLLAYVTYTL